MRIIDRLVIEHVMEWEPSFTVGLSEHQTIAYKDKDGVTHRNFHPSTDIKDAWTAMKTICKKNNWRAVIDTDEHVTEVTFKNKMGSCMQHLGEQASEPLAICEAVLSAVGIHPEVLRD